MGTETRHTRRVSSRGHRAGTVGLLVVLFLSTTRIGVASEHHSETPNLTGHWAQKIVLTSVSDVPVLGRIETRTVSYLRVDIEQQETRLKWNAETCDATLRAGVGAIRTVLPDAFVRAIRTPTRRGRVTRRGGGWQLIVAPRTTVLGATLDATESAPLPTSPTDEAVVDADDDGEPGVTIRLKGLIRARLFVVQRSTDAYRASIDSADRLSGRVDWHADRRLLRSTSPFIGDGPPSRPHPDPDRSWFELVRLERPIDCSRLLSRRSELFER
ncbi:MAG: hypothetical protein ABEL76_02290 [Bradymonadaceae bacterium]